MKKAVYLFLFLLISLFTEQAEAQRLTLPRVFSDHMVLQRGSGTKVWGTAAPSTTVSVTLDKKTVSTQAKKDGAWEVTLPVLVAGGPYTLGIKNGSQTIQLQDVLIGDVWFASGQSNMGWRINWSIKDKDKEIAAANYPNLRLMQVTETVSQKPEWDIDEGTWARCTPQTIGNFSAVAYFFGRNLHLDKKIPVGIIHSSWGGTAIESWMSKEALQKLPDFAQAPTLVKPDTFSYQKAYRQMRKLGVKRDSLIQAAQNGLQNGVHTANYPDNTWPVVALPTTWTKAGIPNFYGFVWLRKKINVPAAAAGKPLQVDLGKLIHEDITYFNGTVIGSEKNENNLRVYQIPANLVKAGENTLAIRMLSRWGNGGVTAPEGTFKITQPGTDFQVSLAGDWRYNMAIEPAFPVIVDYQARPATLFNAMVHPFLRFNLKGIIWYQGEQNTKRADQYNQLFPAMITDWRAHWRAPNLPFLYAQLANYKDPQPEPSEDEWAELREAQLRALRLPYTGMAVTIDLGEAKDVHPRNKQDVGHRLFLAAKKVAYGDNMVHAGPLYQASKIENGVVKISFSQVGSGLIAKGSGELTGFAVAGPDKKFYWAKAVIKNKNTVEVSSPQVKQPVAVRYGWAANPQVNLYNQEGLPASPFRTDTWPGVTTGKK